MKRVLPVLLILALVLCWLPVGASAASVVASGSCGVSVNWVLTDDGVLTIAGNGAMTDYVAYKSPFDDYISKITSVIICSGITHVGNYAFYTAKNIVTVDLPDTLVSIGDNAFYGCSSLVEVLFPTALEFIGDKSFLACSSLQSISFSTDSFCSSIGNYAFSNCSLTSVVLPASLNALGYLAFSDNAKLSTVFCDAVSPPVANYYSDSFGRFFSSCNILSAIYVPSGSVDIYCSADGWSTYAGFIKLGSSSSGGSVVIPVIGVNVSGPDTVELGSTAQYQANVYGSGEYDTSVTWSLDSQTTASGTGIDSSGLLTVVDNETASYITIRATSVQDPTISGVLTVSVVAASEDSTNPSDPPDPTVPPSDSTGTADDGFAWYGDLYLRDIASVSQGVPYHVILSFEDGLFLLCTSSPFYYLSEEDSLFLDQGFCAMYSYDASLDVWTFLYSSYIEDVRFINIFSAGKSVFVWSDYNIFELSNSDLLAGIGDQLGGIHDQLDDVISGESGVDSSVSDFSNISDSFGSSMGDANSAIAGSAGIVSGLVGSGAMTSTITTLAACVGALFDGNEVNVSGTSSNPFELLVTVLGGMALISLVISYVFRKRGDD